MTTINCVYIDGGNINKAFFCAHQFVTITFDDSIQAKLLDTAHKMLDVKQVFL